MIQGLANRRAWRLHIEPSSRCTLACPSCPRTWAPGYDITDCDIDSIVKICDGFERVTFGGTNGDSIYHPKLSELIAAIHSKYDRIGVDIITNGAWRTESWWRSLGNALSDRDTITFSIDGLPHNNHQYRVNSKWNTIETGIKILRDMKPNLFMIWKWILFEYNQYDVIAGLKMAEELGFNLFSVLSSDRDNGALQQTRPSIEIKEEIEQWVRSYHVAS